MSQQDSTVGQVLGVELPPARVALRVTSKTLRQELHQLTTTQHSHHLTSITSNTVNFIKKNIYIGFNSLKIFLIRIKMKKRKINKWVHLGPNT